MKPNKPIHHILPVANRGLFVRIALALALFAAAAFVLPAAANPMAAASATPAKTAATGAAPAATSLTPGTPAVITATTTATATLAPPTAPPAVTITLPPPTPTAVYPPILKTSGMPRFEAGKCPFNLPAGAAEGIDVKCGYLVVLEEHADSSSPALQLAVAIVPAKSANPAADPIVFNQGGPGYSSIDAYLGIMLASPLRQRRDLIAFDQRGTGYSKPALACPEVIDETIATLDQNLSAADANQKSNAASLACRDRLVHAGVNLSAYNTQESAADIENLRVALGYQQLNLYGVSYGSLLVLDTMRFFPGSVRSAIVDGVVPPQVNFNTAAPLSEDRAFTELFKACAGDGACSAAFPNLEDDLFSLVASLNRGPATIHLLDPNTGQTYPALLTGDGLLGALFRAMYQSDLIPVLPEIIHRATVNNFTALEPIIASAELDRSGMIGMYWSAYCAEDGNFNPASISYTGIRPQIAKDQDINNQAVKSLCQSWGVRDISPALNQPVTGSVPTLLFNGRFDPITPPSYGLLAAQTLSNSTVITVPTTAHGAFPAGGTCVNDLMSSFVENPGQALKTACIDNLSPVTFATNSNIVDFSVVRISNEVAARKPSLMLTLLGLVLALLVLLSGLVLFPITWLAKNGRKPPDDAAMDPAAMAGGAQAMAASLSAPPQADAGMLLGLAPWLAILAGLLPIIFAVLFVLTVGPLLISNNGILLLGLPGSLSWLFLLPLVNAVVVLLLVLASLLGLLNKDWSGRRKLYFLVLSLSGITLVVMFGLLGLLTALLGQALALGKGLLPF